MNKSLLARIFSWLRLQKKGLPICWLILTGLLLYEYLARPLLSARYPGLELASIASELAGLIALMGL